MPAGKIIPVAKNWSQRVGDRPKRRVPPDQVFVDPEALEAGVQPLGPRHVLVAVAQEGPVLDWNRLAHTLPLLRVNGPSRQYPRHYRDCNSRKRRPLRPTGRFWAIIAG